LARNIFVKINAYVIFTASQWKELAQKCGQLWPKEDNNTLGEFSPNLVTLVGKEMKKIALFSTCVF
jgi:hypothetical protein